MSEGLAFILFASADEACASRLAAALDALLIPVEQQELATLQFGAGATCVVAWSEAFEASGASMLKGLDPNCAVLWHLGGEHVPDGFKAVKTSGEIGPDAAALRRAMAAQRAWGDKLNDASSPRLGARSMQTPGRQAFAARSFYGLATTIAVAGFVAPIIMERAQATDAANAAVTRSNPLVAATLRARETPATVSSSTPAPSFEDWSPAVENEGLAQVVTAPAAAGRSSVLVAAPEPARIEESRGAAIVTVALGSSPPLADEGGAAAIVALTPDPKLQVHQDIERTSEKQGDKPTFAQNSEPMHDHALSRIKLSK